MKQYLDLLAHVMENGTDRMDRTGTGTKSVFGYQMRFNLSKGFPLLTTKKMFTKAIVHELLWFISGSTNTKYLEDNGVTIWDEWKDENGDLGPVYGAQWRNYLGAKDITGHIWTDQLAKVILDIKKNPNSRRHIVSSWNVPQIEDMALPPCHCFYQFYVANGKLSCQLYQRSADAFLGVPFNIASYALLTHMIAQVCGLEVGDFIHTFGDLHIYSNHIEQVQEQMKRTPLPLPTLKLNDTISCIDDFAYDDITIQNYVSHKAIKGKVSV